MSIPSEALSRQILVDILKLSGPQLGAKLKVQLTAAIGQRLALPRDAWNGLIPKLSHFLASNSDVVHVERPSGPGDIRVSLRYPQGNEHHREVESTPVWYRPEVWAAFVNPDPNRRRFLHRQRHEIVHFSTQSSAPPNPHLAEQVTMDSQFVEIQFAGAEDQRNWLREFLDTTQFIPDAHKRVARHFAELPFDSSINAAFAASLGPHGEAWKRFRSKKVDDLIVQWGRRCEVDLEALKRSPEPHRSAASAPVDLVAVGSPKGPTQVMTAVPTPSESRTTLLRLVESLDEVELRQVLVPLSAVERILRPPS